MLPIAVHGPVLLCMGQNNT